MSDISTAMKTGVIRTSYSNLITAKAAKGSKEEKYSVTLVMDKVECADTITEMKAIIKGLIAEVKAKNNGKLPAGFRNPLKDGDKPKEGEDEEAVGEVYAGCYYIGASNKTKPQIADRTKRILTSEDEVYSGMYAKVSVNFFAYDNVGKGISCSLQNVLKVRDGERLGGGKKDIFADFSDDDFDGIGEDDDDDLFG